MKESLPCPFCGNDKIRIMEDGISKFTYSWCGYCGARGPSAYNIDDDIETMINKCIERWNERNEGR